MVLETLHPNANDLTGMTFGKWKVLSIDGRNSAGNVMWMCECSCGTKKAVNGSMLNKGRSKSCGCDKSAVTTHGMSGTRFYKIWNTMLQRCNNPSQESYKNYGGRGIAVCDRWRKFENFREDLYESYLAHSEEFGKGNTTIDRIDVQGNYEPNNVRWATHREQSFNKTVSIDLRGKTFGSWEVVELGGRYKSGNILWKCRCICGTVRNVAASSLRLGRSSSCGCRRKEDE